MIEHSLSFGPDNGLVGTLCLPPAAASSNAADGTRASAGIILFNAGIVHRVGPHRFNVHLARALARAGIASLRFDLSSLGDSARASGELGYEAQAVSDLRAAMTTLGAASGVERFGLFGFCSGAFHSYNTALADARVAGILLFEAYRYATWKTRLIRLVLRLRQHGVVSTVLRLTLKTLRQLAARGHLINPPEPLARALGLGYIADTCTKQQFAQGVQELLLRGVDVAMIYAGDGFEFYNYPAQFSDAFKHLGITDRVTATFLPDIDHVATGTLAQNALLLPVLSWSARLAQIRLAPPD